MKAREIVSAWRVSGVSALQHECRGGCAPHRDLWRGA